MARHDGQEWVLLTYRLPREPSAPRLAVWRRLRRLGVAQISDGLAGLPADARTREHLEWVAQQVDDAGGTATVWLARPAALNHVADLVAVMRRARSQEYLEITAAAADALELPQSEQARALQRLRSAYREISRRDFYPPDEREEARRAIADLATSAAPIAPAERVGRTR
jgi:hypothetical protein